MFEASRGLTAAGRMLTVAAVAALFAASARAEPATPAHLPDLHVAGGSLPSHAGGQAVQLQLHQRLEFPFDGSEARLSLGPSLTWTFLSPSTEARAGRQQLAGQLTALEERIMHTRGALGEHLTFVRLQHSLWTAALLEGFIAITTALEPGWATADPKLVAAEAEHPGFRRLLQARLELANAELEAGALFRSLTLGLPAVTSPPDATWRPRLRPVPGGPQELELACIEGNPELRRWSLLEAEDQAIARTGELESRLHGQLTLSTTLGLGGGGAPALAWRASLSFAPQNSGAFRLELEATERAVAQTATFNSEPARREPAASDPGMWAIAHGDAHLQALRLAEAWWLAGEAESLNRLLVPARLDGLAGPRVRGRHHASGLAGALEALQDLLYATLQLDSLTLELAAACGLGIAYEQHDYFDPGLLSGALHGR